MTCKIIGDYVNKAYEGLPLIDGVEVIYFSTFAAYFLTK